MSKGSLLSRIAWALQIEGFAARCWMTGVLTTVAGPYKNEAILKETARVGEVQVAPASL
jgi:hypothetical protein